jgi:hypothetical protein
VAVVLAFVQVLIAVQGAMMQVGLPRSPATAKRCPNRRLAGRAQRAQRNMVENLLCSPRWCWWRSPPARPTMTLLGAQIFRAASPTLPSISPAFPGCAPASGSCR